MNILITIVVIASCAFASDQPKSRDGWSIDLANAITEHDDTKAIRLINAGADINAVDSNGKSLMHYAAQYGEEKILKILIDRGVTVDSRSNDTKGTPLFQASIFGHEELVKTLIDHGANVNSMNRWNQTPLLMAIWNGYYETVKLLIDRGANVNAKDENQTTPLDRAVLEGYDDIVKLLIDHGADVNSKDEAEWTLLRKAIDQGYNEIVKILIDHGADVNSKNVHLSTLLHFAAYRGRDEAVKVLIDHGANVNAKDQIQRTPLHRAAFYGYEEIVKTLIDHGADVNTKDEFEWNSLWFAALNGKDKIVEILIDRGADVNAKTINGLNDLYAATLNRDSKNNNYKVLKILIDRGADVNVMNKNGTILHWAATRGNDKIVDLLVDNGADINLKNNDGKTALDIALEKGYTKIADLLDANAPVRRINEVCAKYSIAPSSAEGAEGHSLKPEEELPWMAALGYVDPITSSGIRFKCGGVLISERFIMTAAHCTKLERLPVVVRLGKINLNARRNKNYYIKDIIRHENYSSEFKKNDIALLRLVKDIVFTPDIRPACLETNLDDQDTNVRLYVAGWSTNATISTETSNKLLKAEVQTIPLSQCNATYLQYNQKARYKPFQYGVSRSQYCAKDPVGNGDICRGDSGGPLQIFHNSYTAHVVGIVSFGVSCGSELPTIYTRVALYADWIYSHVWKV